MNGILVTNNNMAFNLFDFSNLGGVSSIVNRPQSEPVQTYTEG